MCGLQLYQTETDELVLVREAFDQGCWLVPDVHSKSPEVRRLSTVGEFQRARTETRHFYIFPGPTDSSMLSVRKIEKENNEFYYVSPGVGAPLLEFFGGGTFSDQDTHLRLIRPGFLECSPDYWAVDLSRKLASPPEVASLFERLCRTVKLHSSKIKPGKTAFWIGEDAQSELQKGARLVGYQTWNSHPIESPPVARS